jgi:long-chain acyl-CoA synthetase
MEGSNSVDYRNLTELHRHQAERLGPLPALRFKRDGLYHDLTWLQYRADALACGAALIEAGVQPGDRVGLLAENRSEWLIADLGILAAAGVNVPPHPPLSARQVRFQLLDAEVRWVFVSTHEQLDKIRHIRRELPMLERIIVFDRNAVAAAGKESGVVSWAAFLQHGSQALARLAREVARREAALGPDDLATIMYTSGTTGNPKGVMLTHGNLLSNAFASLAASPHAPDDVVLNWLPFSHIYARSVDHYQSLAAGVVLCLAESAETLVENLEEIQPTHMASVPRFYEKVLTAVASDDLKKTERRLREIFGPRITWLSSGGAPLPLAIGQAYQAAGLPLYQGYGLTESSPVITFNRKGQNKLGTVGPALPGVEIRTALDGEVLTRGPHVMKGYWKNPEATAEAIKDGWLYTGDLGTVDTDGFLSITGRKKELLVLSNGKKVVPTFIEGLLLGEECIDQAVICGEGRNYLTALIVPHWDNLRRALQAEAIGLDHEPVEKRVRNPAVHVLLRKRICAALANVSTWEQIRKFVILPAPFTVAADELTVSLKLRRTVILAKYAKQIEALYREP